MAVLRVSKSNNYSVVHNGFINDQNISFKAKGVLLYFLSKPDGWEFYIKEIAKNSKDGIDAISSAINELEKAGYIQRVLKRNEKGALSGGYDYSVFEVPQVEEESKEEAAEKVKEEPKQDFTESGKNLLGKIPC